MAAGKKGSHQGRPDRKQGIFMRLINWIAEGTAKAQKSGVHCTN